MTTNLWVVQHWFDHKLVWDPQDFGGVSTGGKTDKTLGMKEEEVWEVNQEDEKKLHT